MPIFFCLLIIFCVWLAYELHKSDKKGKSTSKEFWEREQKSNFVRKQSTDELPRIHFPDTLIMHPDCEDTALTDIESKILDTVSHEIINLTGYSNTDLKLTYGMPNLDYLAECDGYYTRLVSQLNSWAVILYNDNLIKDCTDVLDYAISINADVSNIYILRGQLYIDNNDTDGINHLIEKASQLHTIKRDMIVDKLSKMLSDMLIDTITL